MAVEVGAAYGVCERVTRSRAANFYYGIRLLPPSKRQAMCAVYAFARRVDDIGDGALPVEEKLRGLARARLSLARIGTDVGDPVLIALGHAASYLAIPLAAFDDLIDGVEMDVRGTTYETFDELVLYCRRVAGSIGRLSVGVFGSSDPPRAEGLADDLGVAMQLTNILRDIREDRSVGRVYLPGEDLLAFGCGLDPVTAPTEAMVALIRHGSARARGWFDRGLPLLSLLDRRSAACVAAMTGIYRRILGRIERHPQEVLRRRVALAPWEKAWVAARSLAGATG